MKKIIVFMLLIMCIVTYGQKYKVTYSGYIFFDVLCPGGNPSLYKKKSISLDNIAFLGKSCGKCYDCANFNNANATNDVKIINFKPKKIIVVEENNWVNNSRATVKKDVVVLNMNHCDSWTYSENSFPNTDVGSVDFTFSIEPVINLISPVPDPSCEVHLSADNLGFESNIYNWEYLPPGGTWKPLPNSFQGLSNFKIKLESIYETNEITNNDQTIYFRIKYCTNKYTNNINFRFIRCSPILEGEPIKTKTLCSYSNDGTIAFPFDRPLNNTNNTNERFDMNLDVIENGKSRQLDPKKEYNASFVGKKLTISNLVAGDYELRYQTFLNDKISSAPPAIKFSIASPSPLQFGLSYSNPKCNGDKGNITINATGGTPPYFYMFGKPDANQVMQYDENTKVQFDPLDNADMSVKIDILPAGNYTIKVIDKKTCQEQK
jgi:hypothetical protein